MLSVALAVQPMWFLRTFTCASTFLPAIFIYFFLNQSRRRDGFFQLKQSFIACYHEPASCFSPFHVNFAHTGFTLALMHDEMPRIGIQIIINKSSN